MKTETIFYILIILVVVLAVAGGYFGFLYFDLREQVDEMSIEQQKEISRKEGEIEKLEEDIESLRLEKDDLLVNLRKEQNRNEVFEEQISEISGAVGDLEKLAKTDPELLGKYSKVFFLNEHYTPDELAEVSSRFLFNEDREIEVHARVWPYLKSLLSAAGEEGLELLVTSGYRSFGEQAGLKSEYNFVYGEGSANQFSADQGYSEHQLGTTVDFTTPEVGASFSGFENTLEYTWLRENAHEYGFTLSYPEGNSYYQFEPWHWRFVGVELASDLYESDRYFYDISQREIDKYLADIFD